MSLERERWDDYQHAYEEMLSARVPRTRRGTSYRPTTNGSPGSAASWTILDALMDIDPQYPKVDPQTHAKMLEIKEHLLAEARHR